MALQHLRAGAVTLVLIGGLPGTGKSALAGTLAGRLGFTVLNSDRIRKELAGIPAEQKSPAPYGAGIYDRSWTERTYQELLHRAAELLSRGESVIADASWISAGHRAAAQTMAGHAAADIVQLRCTAPIAVAGFVVILACSLWAVTSYRRMTGISTGHVPAKDRASGKKRRAAKGRRAGKQAGSGLMERLEERWRRRQAGDR